MGLSGYIAAWTLALEPVSDVMGFPKVHLRLAAVCAALGYKTLSGDVSPWALVAVWTLNGLQQHFMQDKTLEMYGCNKQSALGKSMMGVAGNSMLMGAPTSAPSPRAVRPTASRGPSARPGCGMGVHGGPTASKVPKSGPSVGGVFAFQVIGLVLSHWQGRGLSPAHKSCRPQVP